MSNRLTIDELKKLVFEKDQATKSNKDKLFKLAKSVGDIETIERLRDALGFKSARMYLDKLDKLSLEDAIKNRDFEIFKKRIESKSNISKIKTDDLIDKKYDDTFIELLIEKGRYVNVANLARKKYKLETIKLAIENGANINDTYENKSGLFFAIQNNQNSIVEFFLEFGTKVNKKIVYGLTALSFAVGNDANIEIIKLLLNYGADINTQIFNGFTPLISASDSNNIEIVKVLLEYGADINKQTANKGTALILAVVKNNAEIVRILLEHGADVDIVEVTGATALDCAEANNNQTIINLLLAYGSQVREYNFLPLTQAFMDKNIEQIDKLLKYSNINQQDGNETALMHASVMGDVDMIDLLLKYGADINFKSNLGQTALIMASWAGQYNIVKLLLKYGADKNIKGYQGMTAFDVAHIQNHNKIMTLLQSKEYDKLSNQYPLDMETKIKNGIENDLKELLVNKINEVGQDGAKKYFENLNSPQDLEKELHSLQPDSTPFIEKSLKRENLSNEEMCTPIFITSVREYDAGFIYDELKGVSFQSIKTNIGYFLDMPHNQSIVNPDSGNTFPKGTDWTNYLGRTFSLDDPILFMLFKGHIFLRLFNNQELDLKPRSLHKQEIGQPPILIKNPIEYDYLNQAMYDEFYSLVENCYSENDYYLERFLIDNAQYLDVDKLNIHGNTALMSACWRGALKAVKILLYWGANINFQNKEGYSSLMLATDRGHHNICKVLLENEADYNIKNHRGQDCSIFAVKNMNPDIIMLLEDYDVEIKNVQTYSVNDFEEKNAVVIANEIEEKLQSKELILEFLIFALGYNYEYELDIDYYIDNTREYLVLIKPTRETHFSKKVVDLLYDMYSKYINIINISDESKNNIRIKIFDILMEKFQLGKYENTKFEEIEGEEHLYTLKIISNEIGGNIDVFDNHITLKILNNDGKINSFEYKKQSENHYNNEDRGEIIISKKSIIEKFKNGSSRKSEFVKIENDILDINKSDHIPQALSDILKKFSTDERLRYTNHPWTDTTFENFYEDLYKGWDEIKNDIEKLSQTLFKSIDKFLFATDNTDTVGFSSDTIKEQLESGDKKPDSIKTLNESINTFKQSILIKNDENQTLLDLFERVLDKNQLDLDLSLEDIEGFTGRFYTNVRRLEEAIGLILKDINKIDSDAEIKVIADGSGDLITLKIIHKGSTYNNDSKILLSTIGITGNFTSIHDALKSVCHWDVEVKCTDGVQTIHYLYPQRDGVTPYADPKSTEVEGFTHILRFYK